MKLRVFCNIGGFKKCNDLCFSFIHKIIDTDLCRKCNAIYARDILKVNMKLNFFDCSI